MWRTGVKFESNMIAAAGAVVTQKSHGRIAGSHRDNNGAGFQRVMPGLGPGIHLGKSPMEPLHGSDSSRFRCNEVECVRPREEAHARRAASAPFSGPPRHWPAFVVC